MKIKNILISLAALGSILFLGGCRPSPERILKKLDSHAEELKLTVPQKEKYQAFRSRVAEALKMRQDRKQRHEELKAELEKDNPDMNAIIGRIKGHIKSGGDVMTLSLDSFGEFYATLNPDQQKSTLKHFRKFIRHAHHRRH